MRIAYGIVTTSCTASPMNVRRRVERKIEVYNIRHILKVNAT